MRPVPKGNIKLMDSFRPLFFAAVYLMAWWVMSMNGYAAIPDSIFRWGELAIASAILLHCGYLYHQDGMRKSAMFLWFYALACWMFYLESALLIDPAGPNFNLSIAVYNIFRYALMFIVLLILLKRFFHAVRNLGQG